MDRKFFKTRMAASEVASSLLGTYETQIAKTKHGYIVQARGFADKWKTLMANGKFS